MQALLVEILTEELPPKSLRQLSEAFAGRLLNDLVKRQLKATESRGMQVFATPRRLAVLITDVRGQSEDRESEVTGPPSKAPPEAIAGFAKKHGVSVGSLERPHSQGLLRSGRPKISRKYDGRRLFQS